MKKLLLLLTAGVFANLGAHAQVIENLVIDSGSSSSTRPSPKGFKLEFSDLEVGDGAEIHLKIGKAVMDGDGNDKGKYSYVVLTGDKIEGTFSDELDDEIATFKRAVHQGRRGRQGDQVHSRQG